MAEEAVFLITAPKAMIWESEKIELFFIPASNEPSGCLQTFGDCREGQIPRCSAALQA